KKQGQRVVGWVRSLPGGGVFGKGAGDENTSSPAGEGDACDEIDGRPGSERRRHRGEGGGAGDVRQQQQQEEQRQLPQGEEKRPVALSFAAPASSTTALCSLSDVLEFGSFLHLLRPDFRAGGGSMAVNDGFCLGGVTSRSTSVGSGVRRGSRSTAPATPPAVTLARAGPVAADAASSSSEHSSGSEEDAAAVAAAVAAALDSRATGRDSK
ncbi:unnamed protein product, partial [Scytosiphon promiscuus]